MIAGRLSSNLVVDFEPHKINDDIDAETDSPRDPSFPSLASGRKERKERRLLNFISSTTRFELINGRTVIRSRPTHVSVTRVPRWK